MQRYLHFEATLRRLVDVLADSLALLKLVEARHQVDAEVLADSLALAEALCDALVLADSLALVPMHHCGR